MGDLLGSFLVSVRVRTKHAEKTRVCLYGQSAMLKVVWDVTFSASRRFNIKLSFIHLNF